MKEIVLASRNKKKKIELKRLLDLKGVSILTLDDFKRAPEVVENKPTFRGNAIKKAVTTSRHTKKLTLADDSGLQVNLLKGLPGVKSARYAGASQDDAKNNAKLLEALKGKPLNKRKAQFKCVIAVALNGRLLGTAEGTVKGLIGFKEKGRTGFGYDPLFVIPKYKKTFAELGPKIKDRMSHRYKAIRAAKAIIEKYL